MTKIAGSGCRIRIQDPDPDPNPDPLVRGMDPRIRIHPKMSWIRNTDKNLVHRFQAATWEELSDQLMRRPLQAGQSGVLPTRQVLFLA
jgi:hypothetical protein